MKYFIFPGKQGGRPIVNYPQTKYDSVQDTAGATRLGYKFLGKKIQSLWNFPPNPPPLPPQKKLLHFCIQKYYISRIFHKFWIRWNNKHWPKKWLFVQGKSCFCHIAQYETRTLWDTILERIKLLIELTADTEKVKSLHIQKFIF